MKRHLSKGLPWGLAAVFCWLWLSTSTGNWLDGSTEAHMMARNSLLADLRFSGCTTKDAVITAAQSRGWPWEATNETARFCVAPAELTDWLRVEVWPPLPFSTDDENAALFAFDANGCLTRWSYESGPGSSCPDI